MIALERVPLIVRILLPVLWYGFIFYLTAMPGADPHTTLEVLSDITEKAMTNETHYGAYYWANFLNFILRSLSHMFVFGIQALFIYFLFKPNLQLHASVFLSTIILILLLGTLDEVHQSFVPGRTPRVIDVVKDVAGAIIFLTATLFMKNRYLRTY